MHHCTLKNKELLMNHINIVTTSGNFTPVDFQPKDLKSKIINAKDINEIRILLRGNEEVCEELFRSAVKEGDAVTQIQLSRAYLGMQLGEDKEKNFSSLSLKDLKVFSYYRDSLGGFPIFNLLFDKAMGTESNGKTCYSRGLETFKVAAARGYLPARFALLCDEWPMYRRRNYGFAVHLRPFVGKGCRELDYAFGEALKDGCVIGSKPFYEGLHWMYKSGLLRVRFPDADESFDSMKRWHLATNSSALIEDYDGLRFVDSLILAPSQEAWETFVKEKLGHIECAPIESYLFKYDSKQIKDLIKKYDLSFSSTNSFVGSSGENEIVDMDDMDEETDGFIINIIEISQKLETIGRISVQKDSFKIYETIHHPDIKPIVDFIENVMVRTGSASSVKEWLDCIKNSDEFTRFRQSCGT